MRHGTRYAYFTGGCRCDDCCEGRLLADRARRQSRKDRAKADPSIIPHGKWGYADYGCRCEVCVGFRTAERRERLGSQPRKVWTEEEISQALHVYATEGSSAAAASAGVNPGTIRRWALARGVECYQPPAVHGRGRYQRYGCRCEVCVSAYRSDIRRSKADRRSRLDEAPHGTETGYLNWGCRCDPCKDAGSLHNQRVRIRRKAGLTRQVRAS